MNRESVYADSAKQVICDSFFEIFPDIYIYAKVGAVPSCPADHFMVTADLDEYTVVTKSDNLSQLLLIERNKDDYRLISLNVSVPFYSVGFLAVVADAFAQGGMNILMVSTYSKDYLLVRADLIYQAEQILLTMGFKPKEK